jgi:hypothetical protein
MTSIPDWGSNHGLNRPNSRWLGDSSKGEKIVYLLRTEYFSPIYEQQTVKPTRKTGPVRGNPSKGNSGLR